MKAIKLFARLSKAFHALGFKVDDIKLTDSGVFSEIVIDGQEFVVIVEPKFIWGVQDTSEEFEPDLAETARV